MDQLPRLGQVLFSAHDRAYYTHVIGLYIGKVDDYDMSAFSIFAPVCSWNHELYQVWYKDNIMIYWDDK